MVVVYVERLSAHSPADFEDLRALLRQLAPDAEMTPATLLAMVGDPGVAVFVARGMDYRIVGMATLATYRVASGLKGHVEDVVTDVRSRRGGIAGKLMLALHEYAVSLGLTSVSLTCNPLRVQATAMYRKLGYEVPETKLYALELPH